MIPYKALESRLGKWIAADPEMLLPRTSEFCLRLSNMQDARRRRISREYAPVKLPKITYVRNESARFTVLLKDSATIAWPSLLKRIVNRIFHRGVR